jgi:Spy/CpxP family protein refolding chaperone
MGVREHNPKIMNDTPITDEQRKAFADLIKESEKRQEQMFGDYLKSLKDEVAPKLEAKSRTRQFMDDIRNFRAKLSEAAAEGLRRLGFRLVDDGLISIDIDVDRDSRRQFDEARRSAYAEHEEQSAKYRKAIFDVWSAKTADEAREIVRRSCKKKNIPYPLIPTTYR